MSEVGDIIRGHCPKCGAETKAYVRGKGRVEGSDDKYPIDWASTGYVLECCGCEAIYFRRDFWFSEADEPGYDPRTGQEILIPGITTSYYPAPSTREKPDWLDQLEAGDTVLGRLLRELYAALDADLRVMAAIAIRTTLDRAAELLGITSTLTFEQKLNGLLKEGRVGETERQTLAVLIDAGSAAAHRGWRPKTHDLKVMMDVVEAFLQRSFILGDGIEKLKKAVPAKPARAAPKVPPTTKASAIPEPNPAVKPQSS